MFEEAAIADQIPNHFRNHSLEEIEKNIDMLKTNAALLKSSTDDLNNEVLYSFRQEMKAFIFF